MRVLFRGRYFLLSLVFFVIVMFLVSISRVKSAFNWFLRFVFLLCCCTTVPGNGRVGRPLTGLTPPHTLCACPKPGTCNWFSLFAHLLLFVLRCLVLLFSCFAVVPLSHVRGRVERSLTGWTPPHTLCAFPKPGTCNPVVVVVFYC